MDKLRKVIGFGKLTIEKCPKVEGLVEGYKSYTHRIYWKGVSICIISKELWDETIRNPKHYIPMIKVLIQDYINKHYNAKRLAEEDNP